MPNEFKTVFESMFQPGDRVEFIDFMAPGKWRDAIVLPGEKVWDIEEGCSEPVEAGDCKIVARALYVTPERLLALKWLEAAGESALRHALFDHEKDCRAHIALLRDMLTELRRDSA